MKTKFNFNSVPQIWDDYKVLFVFSDDGRVSCRLSFYNDTPQEAFISDLYVHESIRKQGGQHPFLIGAMSVQKIGAVIQYLSEVIMTIGFVSGIYD